MADAPPPLPARINPVRPDVYQAPTAQYGVAPGSEAADDAATLASLSFPKRLAAWVGVCAVTFTAAAVATDKPAFLTEGKGYEVTPINIAIFFVAIGFFLMLQARRVGPRVPAAAREPLVMTLAGLSVALPVILYFV